MASQIQCKNQVPEAKQLYYLKCEGEIIVISFTDRDASTYIDLLRSRIKFQEHHQNRNQSCDFNI